MQYCGNYCAGFVSLTGTQKRQTGSHSSAQEGFRSPEGSRVQGCGLPAPVGDAIGEAKTW